MSSKRVFLVTFFSLLLYFTISGLTQSNFNIEKNRIDTNYGTNGNISSIIEYKNGIPEGEYQIMYKDGTLFECGHWYHGYNIGLFNRYYKNGNPSQIFFFNLIGERDGIQKYYHKNGVLAIQLIMSEGIKIDKIEYWDKFGIKTKTILLLDGKAVDFIYH